MDPLSEVLSLLSTQSSFFTGLKAGQDWAIAFPAPEGIKFNAIVDGECWLVVEGVEQPIRLEKGDCFLLSRQRAFSLSSGLAIPMTDSEKVYRLMVNGIASYGPANEFFLIGGRFNFGEEARLLLDSLPPVAVIKSESSEATVMQWVLRQLAEEVSNPSSGSALIIQHIAHIMLVQFLRIYLTQKTNNHPGWLLALSDARISRVIQAIHADPAYRWTLERLADIAGVSRSTLALRFKQKAGVAPLEYALRWRIQLATRELKSSNATISSIAQMLGYDSDSAFSHAFKRIMQCSPREYRAARTSKLH